MLFSIIILLIIAGVAYFHYVQGLFSATLSAILAAIAATVALSYHETVIGLLKGAMGGNAQALILVGMFGAIYAILRVVFDNAIPGNVQFPLLVDKIGAGVMGVIAGLFASGVFAIAAQSLPLGPSIAGYSRFALAGQRDMVLPNTGGGSKKDSATFEELKDDSLLDDKANFNTDKASGILIPSDKLLIETVSLLSTGALDNGHPLAAIHPDWLTELFGQRLGIQVGAKRVAVNATGVDSADLVGVFLAPDKIQQLDSEHKEVRENETLLQQVNLDAEHIMLIVRIRLQGLTADDDGKVRVSPASVRMVGCQDQNGDKTYHDFHPIGTLEWAAQPIVFRNKADDPLIVDSGKSVDFVFVIPKEEFMDPKSPQQIKDGVFVEVKRMAQLDLSNQKVNSKLEYAADVEVNRKPTVQAKPFPRRSTPGKASPTPPAEGASAATSAPLEVSSMTLTDKLFSPVNPGNYNGDPANVTFGAGNTGTMHLKKFMKLQVHPGDTVDQLKSGDLPISDMFVPDSQRMLQVTGKPPAGGPDPWLWASQLASFSAVDADGKTYPPNGAVARVNQDSASKMLVNYDASNPVSVIKAEEGRPMEVWVLFNIPKGTTILSVQFNGQTLRSEEISVQQ